LTPNREYHEKYRETHRNEINEKARIRYLDNRDRLLKEQSLYYEKNKEKILEYYKKYREKNKDELKEKQREYRNMNKEKRNESERIRHQKNVKARIIRSLRRRFWNFVRGEIKKNSVIELTGCGREQLMAHLESQFTDGMSWDNYGQHGWHIDHIRPCSSFDLTDCDQQKQCFHYTNLQPLWAEDNLSKGARYNA
jgi:hypothetical protein